MTFGNMILKSYCMKLMTQTFLKHRFSDKNVKYDIYMHMEITLIIRMSEEKA